MAAREKKERWKKSNEGKECEEEKQLRNTIKKNVLNPYHIHPLIVFLTIFLGTLWDHTHLNRDNRDRGQAIIAE